MSLWCSVLGHDYGQSVVENEHERRGDSMVFSVLEYEECTRCGERNVISKNKRTTRIDEDTDPDASDAEPEPESTASTPDDRGVTVVDDGQSGGDEPAQSSPSRQPPQPSAPAESPDSTPAEESTEASDEFDSGPADAESGTHADEGVEVLDGESSVEEPTETPSPPPGEPVDEPAASRDHPGEGRHSRRGFHEIRASRTASWPIPDQPSPTSNGETDGPVTSPDQSEDEASEPPITDDAEILEDDAADPHGGWPDPDLADGQAPTSGNTQVPEGEDAEILGEDSGRAPGEWPDPDHIDEDERDQYTQELSPGSDGIIEAGEEEHAESEPPVTEPEGAEPEESTDGPMGIERPASDDGIEEDDPSELFCPQCSFVEASGQSSLRSGDICPECHRGYLGERRR